MKNIDSKGHVKGESIYIDDISTQTGTLFGYVFDSPIAKGIIKNLDYADAEQLEGVVHIFTHKDIPGDNQIGAIIRDEPLLAENELHYIGQPIAFIVAETESIAKAAKKLIKLEFDEKPAITDVVEAKEKKHFIIPPRTFKLGDVETAFKKCDYVFEGEASSGGQEHLYLETQAAYSTPAENDCIKISSSTQGPASVQKAVAEILKLPMHKIEVDVIRLGGAFGGKEDQATAWAAMCALATYHLKKAVKISLHRLDDIRMTGKRHPYKSFFKIGLSKDLKIIAYEVDFLQNAGAAADLSPAILERTLFHTTNSYFVPNVRSTAYSCKTNLPPNTAFRGFGGPQAMFVIESAIAKAAYELNVDISDIQKNNLIVDNNEFLYGQIAQNSLALKSWQCVENQFNINDNFKKVDDFNSKNINHKKGISFMPICFGISFTNTPMNHANALVHIYQDGSIGVSTGAIEMGQGVNTKMLQVAANVFSIDKNKVKLETTNTTRVANSSPTAASSTADLNGKALLKACNKLLIRLKQTASEILNTDFEKINLKNEFAYIDSKKSNLGWNELVKSAFLKRVNLSESAYYATPKIHFDKSKEKGHPFAYHVYGTAITTVTIDCIRGIYDIDSVKIIHDFGKSMNEILDKGQVEGAVVQGIGWITMEELKYDEKGRNLSNALSSYKIPDIYSVPKVIDIKPVETEGEDMAIFKSKAVGEPPFMYGIGTYFAIQKAVKAFNPNYKANFDAPFTPEKVLLGLYNK
ncbi:MAG: molybdopterin-dependent oxidoreductase [Bacteroidales bacterium]|nr:molybdopterin-dependent oxidoreductase [Bacteroidales bacterium]MBN2757547.1 molybdopterin-dependent oxidoreductase [Bacteroidales bacterium]